MLKIISGGQTGIDRMGLEVARELGLPTGGTAPKSYWTENGADPSLAAFGLAGLALAGAAFGLASGRKPRTAPVITHESITPTTTA